MKAYISKTFLGLFAFDEKKKLVDKVLFPKDVKKLVDGIQKTEKYKEKLIKSLKSKGYKEIEESNETGRNQFRKIAKNLGYSDEKLNHLLTQIGIELTRRNVKITVKKDKIIIQVINAIDELDKSINISIARLREWYGLHYPEFEEDVDKHEKFAKIISEYGLRENIPEKKLGKLSKESMGIELSEKDEELLKEFAASLKDLYKLRNHMEKYVEELMEEIAPNFSELATPVIGARLIALAGGMDKLAKKPSSTIQLMGAEKALFRYLKGRGKSPKFGILFTHPEVQKAPGDKRGKIARVLASKMSIAIKVDNYGSKDRTDELREELDERIEEVLDD
ncbi:MAG: C/D box methylation guide ribonucleoprotein complex aNOP56 subunit [Candidatus Aenigmarchaeota archaeon]|nr:C/D box methylation guide ribonucleoprotein complex aNOP56 subunit [Candidatus Aenigmarchaeota archaeon]